MKVSEPHFLPHYPVNEVLPEIQQMFRTELTLVLQAPPGAGKTTLVPLHLIDEPFLSGRKIIMLEPRRIAARSAAVRMSALLNDTPGGIVGYRTRLDTKVSARTRIEVVTEGILTRIIQGDPELKEYGLIVFDEFHERHLHTDLGLALALDVQAGLREDLRILIMSATLNTQKLGERLKAKVVVSEGRSFPVETFFNPPPPGEFPDRHARKVILGDLKKHSGNVLVFLPGAGEIRRLARDLEESLLDKNIQVTTLYGDLSPEEQDRALRPSAEGIRKIVLATSIAETSLTIPGVNIVVDCGLSRIPAYDPATGMTRLITVPVTKASADQRRGRAGRTSPGVCYRLWSEFDQKGLLPENKPEILNVDLSGLLLEIVAWGERDPAALFWLDPPPLPALAESTELLRELGALDGKGLLTSHGKAMVAVGTHPRLSHMLLMAKAQGHLPEASLIAALLQERDIFRFAKNGNSDIALRLQALQNILQGGLGRSGGFSLEPGAADRVIRQARNFFRIFANKDMSSRPEINLDRVGIILAQAYPDRIGKKRSGSGKKYLLSNGRGAFFSGDDLLVSHDFIVAAEVDPSSSDARIQLAAGVEETELLAAFKYKIVEVEVVEWDNSKEMVVAVRRKKLFELILSEKVLAEPEADLHAVAVMRGIKLCGLGALPWAGEAEDLRDRVMFLRGLFKERWPDLSAEALLPDFSWLSPFVSGIKRKSDFVRIDLVAALKGLIGYDKERELEKLAPAALIVPSGSRIKLDYSDQKTPALAVRIQEVFGMKETPRVANGAVAVRLELLSPAKRPIQVTRDLTGFWKNTYPEVRRELKIRYPKHYWPEDPYTAEATSRVRPKAK